MKALVLAGGVGSRLRPVIHTSATRRVPVAAEPVLFYGLEAIDSAGVEDVAVLVGDTAAEIRAAAGDGSRFGPCATCVPQKCPLGLGNNFVLGGFDRLVAGFRAGRPDAQIMLTRVKDPSAFGAAELGPDGRVMRSEERPAHRRGDLPLVGVCLFGPAVHDAVAAVSPSPRGELEITDAIQWLIDHGHDVRSVEIPGCWKDTGSVDDLLEVNRTVLESVTAGVERTGVTDSSVGPYTGADTAERHRTGHAPSSPTAHTAPGARRRPASTTAPSPARRSGTARPARCSTCRAPPRTGSAPATTDALAHPAPRRARAPLDPCSSRGPYGRTHPPSRGRGVHPSRTPRRRHPAPTRTEEKVTDP
ncbi:sugar phosphate nucleotidyltransferase [Streptomyces sp. NPDC050549]|uniref:sugar phosphate nucleotidyltransferase n=1 Tax=Streptomyces sp. NPDC050549 TaxID=3155406 RepID=UPI00343AE651